MTFFGINFRATLGYVADPAGTIFWPYGGSFPQVLDFGGGVTVSCGWEVNAPPQYNRDDTIGDKRFAGAAFGTTAGGGPSEQHTFRLDLTNLGGPGDHAIALAMGDAVSGQGGIYCEFYDDTTLLATVGPLATSGAATFIDATGVERTAAAWLGSNAPRILTYATNIARFVFGDPSVASNAPLAHLAISDLISGGAGPRAAIMHYYAKHVQGR